MKFIFKMDDIMNELATNFTLSRIERQHIEWSMKVYEICDNSVLLHSDFQSASIYTIFNLGITPVKVII